jgi:flagellar hook protein FlgE
MTQGAIQTTGNPLDVAITGEGFFTVKEGASSLYTRAGNFLQDNLGNVTTTNGGIVQGWMGQFERQMGPFPTGNPATHLISSNYSIDTTDTSKVTNITIPRDLRMAAQQTSIVKFGGNLDSGTPLNPVCSDGTVAGTAQLPSNMMNGAGVSPNTFGASFTIAAIQQLAGGAYKPSPVAIASPPAPVAIPAFAGTAYFHTDPADMTSPLVTPDLSTQATVIDSLGNPRSITVWFFQHGADPVSGNARPVWDWYAFDTTVTEDPYDIYTGTPDFYNCIGGTGITTGGGTAADTYGVISFNPDGSLASSGSCWDLATMNGGWVDPITNETIYGPVLTIAAVNNTAGIQNDGALQMSFALDFGTPNQFTTPPANFFVNSATNSTPRILGARDGLTGDVSGNYQVVGGISTYIPNSTAYAKEVNGWRSGDLTGLSVDTTGGVIGQFTNDKSITLAKFAISTFMNPQGLAKAGGNMYQTTSNSGIARMTAAGQGTAGTTVGGALEASNVDLSVELTNMIIAQRGFESNARIITTSSDMLDTLVNVGR